MTLSPEVVRLLTKPATCGHWLAANRASLPANSLPDGPIGEHFVNLFSSFFSTSFRVDHFSLGTELLDANLLAGIPGNAAKASGYVAAQALALRHLGGSAGFRISDAEARTLAKRKSLQPHLLLWTYVWELSRRAKAKGKGEVVHRIWRALPLDLRKRLDSQVVWEAREKLLEVLRVFAASVPETGGAGCP